MAVHAHRRWRKRLVVLITAALGPGAPNSGMALEHVSDARSWHRRAGRKDLSMVFTPLKKLAALRAARPERISYRPGSTTAPGMA